jgi:hypothetical protein
VPHQSLSKQDTLWLRIQDERTDISFHQPGGFFVCDWCPGPSDIEGLEDIVGMGTASQPIVQSTILVGEQMRSAIGECIFERGTAQKRKTVVICVFYLENVISCQAYKLSVSGRVSSAVKSNN